MKNITEKIVKPAALYVVEIWEGKAKTVTNKKILLATEMLFLLASIRSSKTTPTSDLQVLNGSPPWWLKANTIYEEALKNREHSRKKNLQVLKTPTCTNNNEEKIYVDVISTVERTGFGRGVRSMGAALPYTELSESASQNSVVRLSSFSLELSH